MMEIRRRQICGVNCVCLPLKDTAPVIMKGNIYCDMSATLQLHVNLMIIIIIFFRLFFFFLTR